METANTATSGYAQVVDPAKFARYFGDSDTLLRQHCLELAIKRWENAKGNGEQLNYTGPVRLAETYYDFIKGTGKDWTQFAGAVAPGTSALPTAHECIAGLRDLFIQDPAFAYSWHANLACAAMDEGLNHKNANQAAGRFMKNAFNVETSADMLEQKPAPAPGRPNSFEASVEPAGRPRCTVKVVFRPIMNGENLSDYLALRDRYDLDEVNYNGFPLDSTSGK